MSPKSDLGFGRTTCIKTNLKRVSTRFRRAYDDAARSAGAIIARRLTHDPSKPAVERRQVVEASVEGDRRDRVGGQAQPQCRTVQAGLQQELVGRHAGDLPENAQEMIGTGR